VSKLADIKKRQWLTDDVKWLIGRVRQLEDALDYLLADYDCPALEGRPLKTTWEKAREALKEKK
jgi:hypothetical protein